MINLDLKPSSIQVEGSKCGSGRQFIKLSNQYPGEVPCNQSINQSIKDQHTFRLVVGREKFQDQRRMSDGFSVSRYVTSQQLVGG